MGSSGIQDTRSQTVGEIADVGISDKVVGDLGVSSCALDGTAKSNVARHSVSSVEASPQWDIAVSLLARLYGRTPGFETWSQALRGKITAAASGHLPVLPVGWEREPGRVGYSAYIDRFGGDFRGVAAKAPYLSDLGVGYFHPLPFSRPRAGESDGGFAVADFLGVDPALGTVADLEIMMSAMRRQDIAVIIDVVCNHTADDHPWALAAKAGDPYYRDFYHVMHDPSDVDAFEATVPDVFPQGAPGNFTWAPEFDGWVWTTFYPYQWDLNYSDPAVFEAMLDVLLEHVRRGILGFRLDSTLFLWKERETSCRGLSQAHDIVRAWRALVSMVSPEVVFKAEAIDRIEDVLPFFGDETSDECQLSYNNIVMASLWAALAKGDGTVVSDAMSKAAGRPDQGTWINYVRCHDDIIWNGLAGILSPDRRAALTSFYAGTDPTSFAKGALFQEWADGGSVNGMAASLAGVDGEAFASSDGVRRLLLLYGVCLALDGLPVIYMGDEIGLLNDTSWRDADAHASDGRWLHRPRMDWNAADRRHEPGSSESFIFETIARLIALRGRIAAFRDLSPARGVDVGAAGAVAFSRGAEDEFLCIANFTGAEIEIRLPAGSGAAAWCNIVTERGVEMPVRLDAWSFQWLERAS